MHIFILFNREAHLTNMSWLHCADVSSCHTGVQPRCDRSDRQVHGGCLTSLPGAAHSDHLLREAWPQ